MMMNGGRVVRKIPRKLRGPKPESNERGTILKFMYNPLITTGLAIKINGGGLKRSNNDENDGMVVMHGTNKKIKTEVVPHNVARDSKSITWKKRGSRKTVKTSQLMDIRSFFGSGEQRTPKGI